MESKLSKLFHTFTFRLALVYVGLFGLSVILLFAFIYTFAMRYIDTQISDTIRIQYSYLLNEYQENGSSGVEERIRKLIAEDEDGTRVFLLVNREYEKLAGNLNEWPADAKKESPFDKEGDWVRFYIESVRNVSEGLEVKAAMVPLSKWRYILIGQSLQGNQRIEQTIVQTFWASLALTLVMAFIGALVMTRSVMGRLGVINRSVQTIMRGNISTRIPFTRGGDEFDDLSSNLNRMLDRIETLLLSLSQFANNIAHDLRSPLNRIINRLDAGLRAIEPANPAYRLLESNIREMEGLVGTFNSILKISELEAKPDFIHLEQCDLGEIIGSLVEFYEPYASEKNIVLLPSPLEGEGRVGGEGRSSVGASLTPHPCPPPQGGRGQYIILGEKNLLTQAFANLIDNAIKFTPEGGRITIGCERTPEHIAIVIADSGPGIPPEYRDKVFEKFFRLEQSRGSKGNGLGLSLVAAIARIHHAEITLEDSAPGLKVTIRFQSRI